VFFSLVTFVLQLLFQELVDDRTGKKDHSLVVKQDLL
jgi:hypothetical protein